MKMITRAACVLVLGIISVASSHAQTTVPQAPRSFEVASIKPNQMGSEARRAGTSPGGIFTATNVSLKLLISRAFGVAEFQVERGPGWIDTEKYDVAARAETPREMSPEELRPCLQALLAERFRLTFHRETKDGPVYSLVVATSGPRLTEHSGAGVSGIGASSGSGQAEITGTKATMARLAEYLSRQAGRPVIDHTELTGEYDLKVVWSTDQASPGPSIFTAVQEQLGLKLDATRGPIEMVVIDGAEKPAVD